MRRMATLILAPAAALCVPAGAAAPPLQREVRLEHLSAREVLAVAATWIEAGRYDEAQALLDRLTTDGIDDAELHFLSGKIALARKDYPRAERQFRTILMREPNLVRVRLELARTLFMMKSDEQADYHFRLATAAQPPAAVLANIARFRAAIRERRAWRINVTLAIAPDSNINAATGRETVDILGLPFKLNPDARAHSGTGMIVGGDASLRLARNNPVGLYLAAYGRVTNYQRSEFDDVYLGGEIGPEIRLDGGHLRATATVFHRWYGGRALNTSVGGKFEFDRIYHGKTAVDASLALRHDDYVGREDVDGWVIEAALSANRALSPSLAGFGYATVTRSAARDPGYAYWGGRVGGGVLKEVFWGLRPQLAVEVGGQVNDGPMSLFGRLRRDWSIKASASIYKRDWRIAGFAPSLRVSYIRNFSTIALYDQRRLRAELGITKAF